MKKILLAFSLALVAILLIGCDSTTTVTTTPVTAAPVAVEFPVDGEFTAYSVTVSSNKPQVTMVTVTIADGEITGYDIDCRQGTRTSSGDPLVYAFAWNAQTKKELGYGYKMHYSKYTATLADINTATVAGYQAWMEAQTTYLEWFEQAELVEAKWLADGVDSAMVNKDSDFTNVAGVTVSNSEYVKLAKQAVDLARMGKFQTIVCSGTDFYSASMVINNLGEVTNLKLDTLQATKDTATGTFVWNPYSKQELGDNYGMAGKGAAYIFADGAWTASATEKCTLDWYKQANMITDWVMENGYTEDLQAIGDHGVSINGTTLVDGLAGVTIKTETYFTLLDQLFAAWAE